jgi:glucan phosphoethanolaminetransferase (alkaline phosphatase superfamily)
MIQRIQSIYLSLIVLLSILFLSGSFLSFAGKTGEVIKVTFNGIFRMAGTNHDLIEKLLPLSILIILIPVMSLITIVMFKNRKIQLRLSFILIVLISIFVIATIHVSMSVIAKFDTTIIPGIKMFLPILILLFSILAHRGIKKDDQLVKSYDRLR